MVVLADAVVSRVIVVGGNVVGESVAVVGVIVVEATDWTVERETSS